MSKLSKESRPAEPAAPKTRVVVVGGGYAGTMAANHLRLRAAVDITLVNPRPQFVERIRLHQLAAGTATGTADYGTLLGRGIRLVVDTATHIDATARRVELSSGGALEYDYLIYAVGSTGATPAAVPAPPNTPLPWPSWKARSAALRAHRSGPRRAHHRGRRRPDRHRGGRRAG